MTAADGPAAWPGLATERLVLRPWVPEDAPDVHALVTQPQVARMLFMSRPDATVPEIADFIARWQWTGGLKFRCSILVDGEWAGWIGVDDADEPEIFYALSDRFRGQGIAREAVRAFCGFLFRRFPVGALTARVFTDNPASARLLEAEGFEKVSTGLHGSAGRDAPAEAWVFRLSRERWEERA